KGIAQALANVGLVHRSLGAHAEAVQAYRRSLAVSESLGDKRAVAGTLISLASLESIRGEYAKALGSYGRALDLYTALKSKRGIAASLHGLGVVHRQLGEYREALEAYGRALELRKGLRDTEGAAETLNNMGSVYRFLREDEKALDAYRRALANKEALDDKAGMAAILNNIGSVHQERGELKKALAHFHRSLTMEEGLGDRPAIAEVLNNIGVVHQDLGEWENAMAFHQRALDVLAEVPGAVPRTRALWGLAIAHLGLERWSVAASRARDAVAVVTRFFMRLGEQQGATARGRWRGVFETGALAAMREGDAVDLAFFLESGRAGSLLESLSSREALHSVLIPDDLRAKEIAARDAEARAAAELRAAVAGGALDDIRRARKVFEEARAALENLIPRIQRSAKAGAAIAYPQVDGLSDIQKRLGAGEALVLYGLARKEALALVVRRQSARIVPLQEASEVLRAADALLLDGPPYVVPERVEGLTRLVVRPLELGEDVERVLVSPVGRLGRVPFALLMPDREVAYVQSGTTHGLLTQERHLRGEGVVALGDPDYGTMVGAGAVGHRGAAGMRLSPLPETRKGVAAIASVRLLGKEATEATLEKALAARERWRALHLACHGLIDPDQPMLSALALAADDENDGLLTCLEVFRLEVHADLVVLSGCETGKGKIYG
ncbi:MAG: CHAT domain-containing protein, partial [Planctomycetota bacterium]